MASAFDESSNQMDTSFGDAFIQGFQVRSQPRMQWRREREVNYEQLRTSVCTCSHSCSR